MSESDPLIVPSVGMNFHTSKEAYTLWKLYAFRSGFGVQNRGSQKIDGVKYRSTFICSRGRTPRPQHMRKKLQNRIVKPVSKPYKTRRRGVHSMNCQARVIASDMMLNNNWKFDYVHLIHNHKLNPRNVKFFRCHRDLPEWVKKQLDINDLAGVPQKHSFKSVVAQSGGVENYSWISRDMYNHNIATRARNKGDGDASSLIAYFKKRQLNTPEFFYECEYDTEDRLKRVFWADARCRAAYRYFGDVISFDTTYLTNKYGMPFSPFVGVNQHGQTVLLGCALLNDETTETYRWLLNTWVTCMDGKQPKGIITDQCYAMQRAIQEALQETRHRLCLWHIMKKLPAKIRQAVSRQHILPWAQQVVYNSVTELEFEQEWLAIIEEFPETDKRREWFACMFDIRHKWIPVFLNKYFWAGMSTTQRSESINSFFDGFVTGGTPVHVFAWQFAQACRARLQSEAIEDFRTYHETPQLISNHLFEHQVSRLYTTSTLYVFQAEVKQLLNINSTLLSSNQNIACYTVNESRPIFFSEDGSDTIIPGRMVATIVRVDTRSGSYECPCNLFSFRGIVCRHALSVYTQIGRSYIPHEYILSRWCTNQARTDELDALVPNLDDFDYIGAQQLYTNSHSKLLTMLDVCGTNNILSDKLSSGLDRLKAELESAKELLDAESDQEEIQFPTERVIKDPKHATPVGRPRSLRRKSTQEQSHPKRKRTNNKPASRVKHIPGYVETKGRQHECTTPEIRLTNSHTSLLLSFKPPPAFSEEAGDTTAL